MRLAEPSIQPPGLTVKTTVMMDQMKGYVEFGYSLWLWSPLPVANARWTNVKNIHREH
jgi:hypothetical protein